MRRRPDTNSVPELPWEQWWPTFAAQYRVSRDDADHVTIIGPTGTGKTTLAMRIAGLRRYVVVLGTKSRDANLKRLAKAGGFRSIGQPWHLPNAMVTPKALIWPPYRGIDVAGTHARQRRVFTDALGQAFDQGGWHVVCEEMPYLVRDLGMVDEVRQWYTMARSNGAGIIGCTQRPRWIPLEALSSAQHLLIFGTNDSEDLARIGGLNGVDQDLTRAVVAGLGKRTYRFLHVNTTTGTMVISRTPAPTKGTP